MMVGTARSPAVCRASPCRPCLPSALRCSSRYYSSRSHVLGLSRLRLRDGRRSRSRRNATPWRSKHLPLDNGDVRVCCDSGDGGCELEVAEKLSGRRRRPAVALRAFRVNFAARAARRCIFAARGQGFHGWAT
jgi:hypothetical protein